MLIPQLPPESAVATQIRLERGESATPPESEHDPDVEQWSRTEHLLAAVKDEVTALRWVYMSAKGKHKLKWKPEPTPRPGVKSKRKRPRLNKGQVNALQMYLDSVQGAPDDN